jgi:hypothetical protein
MVWKSFKEDSKIEWGFDYKKGETISNAHLNIGCLQRIANATEKISERYSDLIDDRDKYLRWYNEEKKVSERLANQIRGLRGTITRMKKAR